MDFGADARDVHQGRCPTHGVVRNIGTDATVLVVHIVNGGLKAIPLVLCGERTLFIFGDLYTEAIQCIVLVHARCAMSHTPLTSLTSFFTSPVLTPLRILTLLMVLTLNSIYVTSIVNK